MVNPFLFEKKHQTIINAFVSKPILAILFQRKRQTIINASLCCVWLAHPCNIVTKKNDCSHVGHQGANRRIQTANNVSKKDYKMHTEDAVEATDDGYIQELRGLDRWDDLQYSFFVDALASASKNGDVRRLDDLLDASKRAYPITHEPYAAYHIALIYACMFSKDEAVSILLNDARVDPTHRQYACLRAACSIDNPKIVRILLDDPRVDPSFDDCMVLFDTCEIGGDKVMPLLLLHPAVRRSLHTDRLLDHAFRFRNVTAMREIILHAKLVKASPNQVACL